MRKILEKLLCFPGSNAEDLLMMAPSEVDESQLKELNIFIKKKAIFFLLSYSYIR